MIPNWITLTAASSEELLAQALRLIDELGGIDKAEAALKELPYSLQKQAGSPAFDHIKNVLENGPPANKPEEKSNMPAVALAGILALLGASVVRGPDVKLKKELVNVAAPDEKLRTQLLMWAGDSSKGLPGQTVPKEVLQDTTVQVKPDVQLLQTPFLEYVVPKFKRVFEEVVGHPPTITSGVEGEHIPGSFHYSGNALDWRTKDIPHGKLPELLNKLTTSFPEMDVLYEADPPHIHIEPKGE